MVKFLWAGMLRRPSGVCVSKIGVVGGSRAAADRLWCACGGAKAGAGLPHSVRAWLRVVCWASVWLQRAWLVLSRPSADTPDRRA